MDEQVVKGMVSKHEIIQQAEKLESTIPAQFSELNTKRINAETCNQNLKPFAVEEYRQSGIAYFGLIVHAFRILENRHAPRDIGLFMLYKEKLGNETFKTIEVADEFCMVTTKLLYNMQEYADNILDEYIIGDI